MTVTVEYLSIDAIIDNALELCRDLPASAEFRQHVRTIRDLRERLAGGRLRVAVLGQFNRGKSTFINALLGLDVLPISVLPITSVPTVISSGSTRCVISFSNGNDDSVVEGDIALIRKHLDAYVTEANNPKNTLCVSDAIVQCRSKLLEHGTVLIDTPGFGSTHTHNTRTTLDLLASCDAALFLLSADLPITQVEVDFLREVVKTVPRLFFIYNKVDLLNRHELQISEQFIRDTLMNAFGFTLGVRLFPVSARMMLGRGDDTRAFEQSGLAAVEKEILDFLLREKYFTLSEALTGKFRDALAAIIASLTASLQTLSEPVDKKKTYLDQVAQVESTAQAEVQKAMSLAGVEETALYEYCDAITKKKRAEWRAALHTRAVRLVTSSAGARNDELIGTAIHQVMEEVFNRLHGYYLAELNRPLRNAAKAHVRELCRLRETADIICGCSLVKEVPLHCAVEQVEFDTTGTWLPEKVSLTPRMQKSSLRERLAGNEKRALNARNHYVQEMTRIFDAGLEELLAAVHATVASVLTAFIKECREDYIHVQNQVQQRKDSASADYEKSLQDSEPEITHLKSLIEGFTRVQESLV
jgi:ribosome biogenesis GTPase A